MSNVILITGVSGFIGRYVARLFSEYGWSVVGVDNSLPENSPTAYLIAYRQMSLPDLGFADLLKEYTPEVCIHCAGRASVGASIVNPHADFYTNAALTFEVLDALRQHAPACRFIFLSSAAAYGNPKNLPISEAHSVIPLSPYGFHKLQCEQLCLEFARIYGLQTASVRIFSAYGPGLRRQVMWDICQKALSQPVVTLQGTGQESRDFIHVSDIAKALLILASVAPMQGELYNLASGREVTIRELANLVLATLDIEKKLEFDDVIPEGTPLNWQADISKLMFLGFNPAVTLEKGVSVFASWCRAELVGY